MEQKEETKPLILEAYKKILEEKHNLPTYKDFILHDISRDKIRNHFGGIESLHIYFKENHEDILNPILSTVENIFSEDKKLDNSSSKYVITTAVADAPADKNFLAALRYYCQVNDAQLVIMPCENVTNSFENKTAIFDPIFNSIDYKVVSGEEDTILNDNFSLCSIQVSAKQIKSITGLARLGNREGSYVFASPKQFLEYVPSGNNRGKNYAIMTPGACTKPSYYTDTYVSKRLSYIAALDHTIGAIIVDIINDKQFDFRQIQADENGSFIDFGVEYNADGTSRNVPSNVILGDLHSTYIDRDAVEFFINKFKKLDIDNLFLHDVFDGYSISHHVKDIREKSDRASNFTDSLSKELLLTANEIKYIDTSLSPKNVRIVKSNHDEFLDRYLAAGNYVTDPKNHRFALECALGLFEDTDVLLHSMSLVTDIPEHWDFMPREHSFRIGDVECAAHGDLGMNGAKNSLNSLEKIYGSSVTGHTHSAAIQRRVFRVGTLSKMDMRYNRGPSSWTHTCCLLYENGQKQLINYIPGEP